eukprot:154635-Karenia_brevis.AAC.1
MFCGMKGVQAGELLFVLRRVQEMSIRWSDWPIVTFGKADFHKAFDKVWPIAVARMWEEIGLDKIVIYALVRTMVDTAVNPSIAGLEVGEVLVRRGVRQGRVQSMIDFVLAVAAKLRPLISSWIQNGIGLQFEEYWLGMLSYADGCIFIGRTRSEVITMITDTAGVMAHIGLTFSFKPGKTEIMQLLQTQTLHFPIGGNQVSGPVDGNLRVLKIPFNPYGAIECELAARISKLHAAAAEVAPQIYNKKASFVSRLGVLHGAVASAATWAIEVHAPNRSFLEALNVAYINICVKMSGRKFGGDGEWGLWVGGVRGAIKRLVRQNTGDIIDLFFMKHYRFAGHVARNVNSNLCSRLSTCRGQGFIDGARRARWRHKPAYCRQGGQQLPVYDRFLYWYFLEAGMGDWVGVAGDRSVWKHHESTFMEFARCRIGQDC